MAINSKIVEIQAQVKKFIDHFDNEINSSAFDEEKRNRINADVQRMTSLFNDTIVKASSAGDIDKQFETYQESMLEIFMSHKFINSKALKELLPQPAVAVSDTPLASASDTLDDAKKAMEGQSEAVVSPNMDNALDDLDALLQSQKRSKRMNFLDAEQMAFIERARQTGDQEFLRSYTELEAKITQASSDEDLTRYVNQLKGLISMGLLENPLPNAVQAVVQSNDAAVMNEPPAVAPRQPVVTGAEVGVKERIAALSPKLGAIHERQAVNSDSNFKELQKLTDEMLQAEILRLYKKDFPDKNKTFKDVMEMMEVIKFPQPGFRCAAVCQMYHEFEQANSIPGLIGFLNRAKSNRDIKPIRGVKFRVEEHFEEIKRPFNEMIFKQRYPNPVIRFFARARDAIKNTFGGDMANLQPRADENTAGDNNQQTSASLRDSQTTAVDDLNALLGELAIDNIRAREEVTSVASEASPAALSPTDEAIKVLRDLDTNSPAPLDDELKAAAANISDVHQRINELTDMQDKMAADASATPVANEVAVDPRIEPLGPPPSEAPPPPPSMSAATGAAAAADVSDRSHNLPGIDDEETRQAIAATIASMAAEAKDGVSQIANAVVVPVTTSSAAADQSAPKQNPVIGFFRAAADAIVNFFTRATAASVGTLVKAADAKPQQGLNGSSNVAVMLASKELTNAEKQLFADNKALKAEHDRIENRHANRIREIEADKASSPEIRAAAIKLENDLVAKDRLKFRQKLHAAGFEGVERHDPAAEKTKESVVVNAASAKLTQEQVDNIVSPHVDEATKFLAKVMLANVQEYGLSDDARRKRQAYIAAENGYNDKYTMDNFIAKYGDLCHILNRGDTSYGIRSSVVSDAAKLARNELGIRHDDTVFTNSFIGRYGDEIQEKLNSGQRSDDIDALIVQLQASNPEHVQFYANSESKAVVSDKPLDQELEVVRRLGEVMILRDLERQLAVAESGGNAANVKEIQDRLNMFKMGLKLRGENPDNFTMAVMVNKFKTDVTAQNKDDLFERAVKYAEKYSFEKVVVAINVGKDEKIVDRDKETEGKGGRYVQNLDKAALKVDYDAQIKPDGGHGPAH